MFLICCGLILYGLGAFFFGFAARRVWFQFRIYNAKRRVYNELQRRLADKAKRRVYNELQRRLADDNQ